MSKIEIAHQLRQQIQQGMNLNQISQWAYLVHLDCARTFDNETREAIETLMFMAEGPQFELSEVELVRMAETLEATK